MVVDGVVQAERFDYLGLKTLAFDHVDTGPTFIDTDGPTCRPPECHHNQGLNLSSVVFAIFSYLNMHD